MNVTESMQDARQRREIVVDVLAETLLEMLLQGRGGAARQEPEEERVHGTEQARPQRAEVCHGAG